MTEKPIDVVPYVAFRRATLEGRIPPEALRLASEVICEKCGGQALASATALATAKGQVDRLGYRLFIVCDGCAADLQLASAAVVGIPRDRELERIIDRKNAERN